MKRPGLITFASIAANLVLAASLVHVYQTTSDTAFKSWVDQNILSTFTLILGGSLIAGSAFGYFLLRRKGTNIGFGTRAQRTGPQRQPTPYTRPTGIPSQARNVPIGPPPGPTSKHTAYAVPPLSKAQTQSSPRQTPSWSDAPRQWSPATFRAQRQEPTENPSLPESQYPVRQIDPQSLPGSTRIPQADRLAPGQIRQPEFSRPAPSPQAVTREPVEADQPPRWEQQPANQLSPPRTSQPYQAQSPDNSPVAPFLRQPLGPVNEKPVGFTPPADNNRRQEPAGPQNSWSGPGQTPAYPTSQKWLPPSASPVQRPPSPPSSSFGQTQPKDQRPNFAGPQGAPRPLGFAGPFRQNSPVETPPYQERRPTFPSPQQASETATRPTSAPRPIQTSNLQAPSARPEQPPQPQNMSSRQTSERPQDPPPSSGPTGGEMDWDTALDAILKTLRKDKVEDKP